MTDEHRRKILKHGAAVVAAGVLCGLNRGAGAADHAGHSPSEKRVPAVVLAADQEGICGTCRFWGGVRRASEDKQRVYCESLGWCNNPKSHNYQTMTTPTTGPMKGWRKWEAL